jgi:hypothetical protein
MGITGYGRRNFESCSGDFGNGAGGGCHWIFVDQTHWRIFGGTAVQNYRQRRVNTHPNTPLLLMFLLNEYEEYLPFLTPP